MIAPPKPQDLTANLALNGGPKTRTQPFPARKLYGPEERDAVMALMDQAIEETSNHLGYNGPMEKAYCDDFVEMMGGGFADGVNSGTNAVYAAIAALELEPLSEVIVPAITDPGGVMPVGLVGCVPVPADSEPGYYNISVEQIRAVLTERTKAILLTHIAGIPVDMDPILELAAARGIAVVEDCAQAHHAKYKGRFCGTIGDIAAFSTMFGKQHASGGQGGIVYTRREDLYWKARRYADRGKPFGLEGQRENIACSINANMDELHAVIGRANLAKLPGFIHRRRKFMARVLNQCRDLKAVRFCEERPGDEASYWFATYQLEVEKLTVDRNEFARAMGAEGIPCAGYPFFPTRMPWARDRCPACGKHDPCSLDGCPRQNPQLVELPNATAFEASSLRFQFHEGWTEDDADDVAAALHKVEQAFLKG